MMEFCNFVTQTITQPIHDVLKTLFRKYGKVQEDDVTLVKKDVENMSYDLSQPLAKVWNEIKDLQALATAADTPFTDKQLVALGIKIIKNTHDFEQAHADWIKKPVAAKTFNNLQTHFDDALELLQQVRGDDMQAPVFHQAN